MNIQFCITILLVSSWNYGLRFDLCIARQPDMSFIQFACGSKILCWHCLFLPTLFPSNLYVAVLSCTAHATMAQTLSGAIRISPYRQ